MKTVKTWMKNQLIKQAEKDPVWVPVVAGAALGAGTAKASNKMAKNIEQLINAENRVRGRSQIEFRRLSPALMAALGSIGGLMLHSSSKKLKLIRTKKD